jgi:hypothetical protein
MTMLEPTVNGTRPARAARSSSAAASAARTSRASRSLNETVHAVFDES